MSRTIHTPEHRQLCQILIDARLRSGLTQRELAAKLKRPQSYIAKIEGGERRVDVIEFLALAEALEQSPTKLLRRIVSD